MRFQPFACLAILFAACLAAPGQPSSTAAADVTLDSHRLWTVKAPRAGVSIEDRAKDIRDAILYLAQSNRSLTDDVRAVHLDSESILLISRVYIFSVTDEDARLENRSRRELFTERQQLLLSAIGRYREERQWKTLLRSALFAGAALTVALLLLVALRKTWSFVDARIPPLLASRGRAGRLASWYSVFEAPLLLLTRLALAFGSAILGLSIFITSASFALGQFPLTQEIAAAVRGQVWLVLGGIAASVVAFLPNLIVLITIGVAIYALLWSARTIARSMEDGTLRIQGMHQEWAQPTYSLLKVLLILFGLVVAFPYLPGGESPALKGASIFIGVLISLGSGSAMGNVIAGVILIYMRAFRVGDRVKIGDTTGDIIEKGLLVTRIRTIKNVEVILPNSAVLGAHILNYSALAREHGLILNTTVTLGYDIPGQTIRRLMTDAALATDGILSEPAPFVLQTSLNDWHISYELNAYTSEPQRMADLYSELHRNIHEQFISAGVEIMSPSYFALRDGNAITISPENLPKDYKAPSFQVRMDPDSHIRSASAGSKE